MEAVLSPLRLPPGAGHHAGDHGAAAVAGACGAAALLLQAGVGPPRHHQREARRSPGELHVPPVCRAIPGGCPPLSSLRWGAGTLLCLLPSPDEQSPSAPLPACHSWSVLLPVALGAGTQGSDTGLSRQELCKEMESKQETYDAVRDRLQRLLGSCRAARPCSTEHSLRILEQKWESVHAEAQERKVRGAGACCPPGGADPAQLGGLRVPVPVSIPAVPAGAPGRGADRHHRVPRHHAGAAALGGTRRGAPQLPRAPQLHPGHCHRADPGAQGKCGRAGTAPSHPQGDTPCLWAGSWGLGSSGEVLSSTGTGTIKGNPPGLPPGLPPVRVCPVAWGLAPALGLPTHPSHVWLPSGPGEGGKCPRGKAEQPGGRGVAPEGLQQEAGRSRDPEPRADGQGAAGQGAAAHGGARGGSGGGSQAHQAGTRPGGRGHGPCRELCRAARGSSALCPGAVRPARVPSPCCSSASPGGCSWTGWTRRSRPWRRRRTRPRARRRSSASWLSTR